MISYEPLWRTLKEKNISVYKLLNEYGLSHGTYDSLKHNRNITLSTVEWLCKILKCQICDIVEYIEDEE